MQVLGKDGIGYLNDVISISTGYYHTVAIKTDGTLWAWGHNNRGQLGDGMNTDRSTPVQENTEATDWVSVSAGYSYTVGFRSDGTLWAWGWNNYGQLGDGTTTNKNIPERSVITYDYVQMFSITVNAAPKDGGLSMTVIAIIVIAAIAVIGGAAFWFIRRK